MSYFTWKVELVSNILRIVEDYADIIYDQANNINLCNKTEICQYNVALAINGAITGSLKERLYQEVCSSI